MTIRIGVISDTHGTLRPDVVDRLTDCDYILHAGDIDREPLLLALQDLAPVCAVRGNNDWGDWARELPFRKTVTIGGVKFFLVHKRDDIPLDLGDAQVVIYGHSHQWAKEERGGRLWLNPGSCGRPRFRSGLSMAILTVENGSYQVEKIELPVPEGGFWF